MNIRKSAQQGRRPRRRNGDARSNKPWSVKGVEQEVKDRISFLAVHLGTTNAAVIEQATKLLLELLIQEDKQNQRKGITFSHSFDLYKFLLVDDSESSNDPAVSKLKERLQERKRRRDMLMGRISQDATPGASKGDREA